ncbi:MAG: divergent PAP2 family protein [Candidatus Peregrinibacteria bacterium]
MFNQYPILIPFIAILLAEMIKAMIDLIRKRKSIRFLRAGGMPSGHSAFVGALVVTVANHEGVGSTLFMVSAVLAIVVMYDAIHLRGEAGKHAVILNQLKPEAQLEESLGHTHWQVVVGAVFGALVALVLGSLP